MPFQEFEEFRILRIIPEILRPTPDSPQDDLRQLSRISIRKTDHFDELIGDSQPVLIGFAGGDEHPALAASQGLQKAGEFVPLLLRRQRLCPFRISRH